MNKIILSLLPYWTPQIPPLGISALKSFLLDYYDNIKTFDFNIDEDLRENYDEYFNYIKPHCEVYLNGSFYNIGHDVLQNHMMAFLNKTDDEAYCKLVKVLIYNTFYIDVNDDFVEFLNQIIHRMFDNMRKQIIKLIDIENPDVFGLSVYKGNLPLSLYAFKIIKSEFPNIITVMGGAVFAQTLNIKSPDFKYFLNKYGNYIDKIIVGEGELLFLKALQESDNKDKKVYLQTDIDNKLYDISSAKIPDFSDLNMEFYPTISTYTSRSCPFQCNFCTETMYWGEYRKKPDTQIVNDLISLNANYGSKLFLLCDSLINPIISNLSKGINERKLDYYWDGYLRIDKNSINADEVYKWRKGGFYRARIGIESGSEDVLKKMNKNISIDSIKRTLINLANHGIKTTTYWIVGYPEETLEDFNKTLKLIDELSDYIYEAHCNPFGYYYDGQPNSNNWADYRETLYPEWSKEMLLTQTWTLNLEPTREETYNRLQIFAEHCAKLGIANPYSLYEINKADDRWKSIHFNAVPPLVQFKNKNAIIKDEFKDNKIDIYYSDFMEDDDFIL